MHVDTPQFLGLMKQNWSIWTQHNFYYCRMVPTDVSAFENYFPPGICLFPGEDIVAWLADRFQIDAQGKR